MIIGERATELLSSKKVAIFGLGGVGSYAAEAIARCGVGKIELIDSDTVSQSNINRQLCALNSTVGRAKVDVVAERIRDINPCAQVVARQTFFLPESADGFDFSQYDYVVDAIDTVSAKIEIALRCAEAGVPLISCMGTGNKLDPQALKIADLAETAGCPLARVMRRELKKRGIEHLRVVYSEEAPIKPRADGEQRTPPGSIAFVPSVAGLLAASEVIRSLIADEK